MSSSLGADVGMQRTCFACEKLNDSTFLIVEDDKYDEHPFIYAKIYLELRLIVLSDTGCGGRTRDHDLPADDLRNFLETYPVENNGNRPLNPRQTSGEPTFRYMIFCTHCHYDHILGIPSFVDVAPSILASSYKKSFIEDDLPKHSLCHFLDVPTPKYKVSYWAKDLEEIEFEGSKLSLQILQTPGHTPDELAWYDEDERHLYVGDSFYERVARDKSYTQPIIFPAEGDVIDFMGSLEKMIRFVREKNSEDDKPAVKIGCGHITCSVDGLNILLETRTYFRRVIDDDVPIKQEEEKREELFALWQEDGNPRFSLLAQKRLIGDARQHFGCQHFVKYNIW